MKITIPIRLNVKFTEDSTNNKDRAETLEAALSVLLPPTTVTTSGNKCGVVLSGIEFPKTRRLANLIK